MPPRRVWTTLITSAAALVGGATAVTVLPSLTSQRVWADSQATPVVTDVVALSDRFALVSKRIAPAVVSIEARKTGGPNGKKQLEDTGSGVIVKLDNRPGLYVLTNNHIIEGSTARDVLLMLADGRLLHPSRILTYPAADVAVLHLDTADTLPSAPLGDSDQLQQGHWVLAIGSPYSLSQTVTHGIVSALGRGQVGLGAEIHIKDFIQSDTAINPGSSGGPLLNLRGEVVGINTAIASPSGGSNGISFSIPINYYRRVMDQLIEKGTVTRGYFGIQLAGSLDPFDAERLGLDRGWGALIEAVHPRSPAEQAGLQVGDVILEINQQIVRNENHCIKIISGLPLGKPASLVVWRDRRRVVMQATVDDYAVRYPQAMKR